MYLYCPIEISGEGGFHRKDYIDFEVISVRHKVTVKTEVSSVP